MAQPALHLDAPQRPLVATLGAYLRLTKPRVIELLLVVAVPPMFLAEGGLPPLWLILAVVAGGAMAAGGANTINCWIERDRDQLMHRTDRRPLRGRDQSAERARLRHLVLNVLAFACWRPSSTCSRRAHAVGHAVLRLRVHDLVCRARCRTSSSAVRPARYPRSSVGRRCATTSPHRRGSSSRSCSRDSGALLGAGDEVPRRLRRSRHSHAARRAGRAGHGPPDRRVRDDHRLADASRWRSRVGSVASTRSRPRNARRDLVLQALAAADPTPKRSIRFVARTYLMLVLGVAVAARPHPPDRRRPSPRTPAASHRDVGRARASSRLASSRDPDHESR